MHESKSIIDLSDEEIREALGSEHHRRTVPSYAFLVGELQRRADERNASRAFLLAAAVGIATIVNVAVAVASMAA